MVETGDLWVSENKANCVPSGQLGGMGIHHRDAETPETRLNSLTDEVLSAFLLSTAKAQHLVFLTSVSRRDRISPHNKRNSVSRGDAGTQGMRQVRSFSSLRLRVSAREGFWLRLKAAPGPLCLRGEQLCETKPIAGGPK